MAKLTFPGFDERISKKLWAEVVRIPERIFSVDGKRFVRVSLDSMTVPSDADVEATFRINEKFSAFEGRTRDAAAFVLLTALDGKRKSSTVLRWESEFGLFGRMVSAALGGKPIATITLKMYLWYCAKKNPSQEKLLRGFLLYWIGEECPGIQTDLRVHLLATPPRKPRGMIEVQNAVALERPLSMPQVRGLLLDIEQLYQSGEFTPQTHLLWRLMISEALRPAQMALLHVEDVTVKRDGEGRLLAVQLAVPMVKQSGIAARDFMSVHRLSRALSQAVVDQLEFIESVLGEPPSKDCPLFCVRSCGGRARRFVVRKTRLAMHNLIGISRQKIAALRDVFVDVDLFNRRFKHTKLTHLAAAGAPIEVLAHAGFQTSTVSLVRYVNLTEEAFLGYEAQLEPAHNQIADAFRGHVIARDDASHKDPEHRIASPDLSDDVGACADEPCGVLFCRGCYGCPHFEAFDDGPHQQVEADLIKEQERARAAGMPEETVLRNSRVLASVRAVIKRIALGQ